MDNLAYIPAEYEILGEAGRGTSGIVYKALDKQLSRIIALKIPLAARSAAFLFECRVLAGLTLGSPIGIPKLHAVNEYRGRPYYLREFVEGSTLEHRVTSGTICFKQALVVLANVARTINVVHQWCLVHRNLYPSNVLISDDGTPALIGFGHVGVSPGRQRPREPVVVCTADVDLEQLGRMLIWLCAEVKQTAPLGLTAICQRYSAARLPGNSVNAAMLADELDRISREANTA
ncbi:MAG: protein kinase domain-containing protein [Thermoguttaceae bacterium]